ncbi:MAG: exo-alpha-sialidase [Bacteroidaceae bacterium]|nr:exo-alpha-sialidase [Bacteroidaceae bacterium]
MNLKQKLTALLLLAVGAVTQLNAQVAVTVGSQVTDASNIVSGKAYVLQSQAAGTGTLPFINDNGANYDIPMSNACNESSVYYLISNGDGTWKIKNYYTNHFWGVPVYDQAIASVADEASAGAWSLNFSNGIAYPSAPDANNTVRGLDRSSNKLHGYGTGDGSTKQVKIFEVGPTEKGLTSPVSIVSGWYLIKWIDINDDTNTNYTNADVNGKYVKNYAQDVTVNSNNYSLYLDDVPTGTDGIALSLVYFEKEGSESGRGVDGYLRSANGHYVRQTGAASNSKAEKNYIIYRSSGTPNYSVVTSGYTEDRYSLIPCGKDATPYIGQTALNKFPVAQFYSVDFSLYGLQPWSVEFDGEENAQVTYTGSNIYGLTSVYNGGTLFFDNGVTPSASNFSAPTRWGFSPDIEVDATSHTIKVTYIDIHKVYTINNTNSNRGALIYNPENPKYVWSSGKSGTFNASNANSQWVIIPTETTGQFYLYNIGAGKFAIPTGIAQSASNSWVFSDDAVAVIFEAQGDGTKKIKMASTPVSGTNAAYMAVSNSYTGPIINYNDAGGNFTITKVDGDASTAANDAVAKLVKNQTALTGAVTADNGWYVISIKTTSNSTATASPGRYIYPGPTNQANYPLTFTGGVDVQPAISDATFFTRFVKNGSDYNWQMTNGQYLINRSNVFPTPSSEPVAVVPGYDNGNYIKSNGIYADPYVSNGNFFIGETASYRTTWSIYPIDLTAAGLTAWQVLCDNAPESAQITCSRSDVSGLTAVYKNGFFFLPTGVTPESTDFNLDGATDVTVDASAHTVTFAYDPNLAIVEDGVIVEQGWQTAGRDSEVMLLRVTAKPFKAATNTTLTVSLKDGSEANISTLKIYEANNDSPEIYSTGDGAPTKTEVATASISGSTATFNIGNLTASTHYYWIGATVSSTATLGAVLDAAVTGIAYQVEGQTAQNLDLTSVGDPADRGAMVFNVRSYPFLPRDNGSRVYRIPAMIVAEDGSIVVAADKRYDRYDDIGNSHVIDIVVRRSTDGGKTWSAPLVIAKGENTTANGGEDSRCGFGDPSLVKGKDGKLYCLFAAGNEGYFKGQKGMCMSVSTDNGVTWSSGEGNPPIDLYRSGAIKNVSTVGEAGFGLYDYFVTSGRGLYIPEDDILMYLIPAQTMTSATEHTGDSQDYIFYSRDGGESWYFSETPMVQGGDEAKIIQMNDGSLFGSIRKQNPRRFNTATYTKNNDGKTLSFNFGTQWDNSQLSQTHQNNQDIYYYQRETTEGKTDVIIHSITTGNHVNFKLFYSTDKGVNWTEFLNVQTKGTRYVTMDKNPANGSLYLFFEDQSLNSAGGYTDYNHYPLNFIEITRDQLVSLIPALEEYNVPEYLKTNVVKNTVYQTSTGCDSYGAFSGTGSGHWARTWTSNASSGMAGLTVSTESGYGFDKATVLGTRVMTIRPSANGATDTYTITAPSGYVISSYTIGGAVYTGGTYRITAADGTTTGDITSTTTPTNINVTDVNASSTTFTFYGASQSNWFAITNFTITLAKPFALNAVGGASYATLYLPFDVTTTGETKAYYIETTNNGAAQLTATGSEGTEIPANTAVVLVNEDADASTILNMTDGLTPVISESENLLKGTLVPMSLDLGDETPNYSLGTVNGNIGFYKFDKYGATTITLGANKAYLSVPAASGVKGFTFDFDDATGIVSPLGETEEGAAIYNLAGQRLSKFVKGINIINGKKVLK